MKEQLSILVGAALLILPGGPSSAVTIDWVTVGDPGNAGDPQELCTACGPGTNFGAVANTYRIAKTEVTNAQYAEFLNAKAASDPNGLYNTNMGSGFGGITRSGSDGSYTYGAIAGRENKPVNYVSFNDSLRFANWLNNGQGGGDTETGAYTMPPIGTPTAAITRNAGASIFLPSEDEWYKAAYFDGTRYFDYPVGTDTQTVCATPGATANTANCSNAVGDLTDVGSYTGSASPYGTFDQGGNVHEWNEGLILGLFRNIRGGAFKFFPGQLEGSFRPEFDARFELDYLGFRVASQVPEPGTSLLLVAGVLGWAGWRMGRA